MPVYPEKEKVNGQTRWFIRAYVKDSFGSSVQIKRRNKNWVGREGKAEALRQESIIKEKFKEGGSKVRVQQLIEEKISQDAEYLKESSIKRYNELLNIYIIPFFSNAIANDLTPKRINEWHMWINKKNIALETKKKIHGLLSSSLDYGAKFYGLKENPCKIVGNFKEKNVEKKEMEFLTYNEFKTFISYEKDETYRNFFSILFYTGMRRGELLAITDKDIDLHLGTININKSINPKNGTEPTVPKTKKANRVLPVLKECREIFENMENIKGRIFGLEKIKPATLQRKCKRNCELAGITKHIRIHDFRHSFVALCIECGVRIEKISQYVGHKNIRTTYSIYAHLYPNANKDLVDMVDNYLIEQAQKQAQSNSDMSMSPCFSTA